MAEEFLIKAGLTSKYVGFKYLVDAIELTAKDNTYLEKVTSRLYPMIADKYNSNWHTVERNMRLLVEKAWDLNAKEVLKEAGYKMDFRPYTREFIYYGMLYTRKFKS